MKKRKRKSRKVLTDQAARNLLQRFAAPLFRSANSATQKEAAQRLAQTLWLALVAGPEVEETLYKLLAERAKLNSEDIQAIQDCYYREMKPLITEEELRTLKARYRVRKLPRGERP